MATTTTAASTTATDKKADADKPVNLNHLVALLAADWVRGDKANYARIRQMTLKLLDELGEDGEEARARLVGEPAAGDARQMHEDIAALQAVLDAHHIAVPVGMTRRASMAEPLVAPPVEPPAPVAEEAKAKPAA
jgi:hypothetical protein